MKYEITIATDEGYKTLTVYAEDEAQALTQFDNLNCNIVQITPKLHEGKLYIKSNHKLSVLISSKVQKLHVIRAKAFGETPEEVRLKFKKFIRNNMLDLGDYRLTGIFLKRPSIFAALERFVEAEHMLRVCSEEYEIFCTVDVHYEPLEVML